MALTPRLTLDEAAINGMKCAICVSTELKIIHVDKYPDFVSCNQCGSAFVIEREGSWVMYGKIPQEYPETSQFALKQWTWLDAVAQRAEDERTEKSKPLETSDPIPVTEESPPTPEDSAGRAMENSPVEGTEAPPPFIEEKPSPPLEDLFPEDPIAVAEDGRDELSQMPPFPQDVIILGGDSSDISAVEDVTPSFMEHRSGPEEVLVPTPFDPIEVLDVSEYEEPEPMPLEDEQLAEDKFIEDISDQVIEEIPGVFEPLPVATLEESRTVGTPEAVPSTPKKIETELAEEPPQSREEQPISTPTKLKDKSLSVPVGEPEPDKRFQITIQGSQPKYPKNYCAHCLQTPVKLKTIMRGSLPDPKKPGQRKMVPLELPFCKDCQKRMDARSQDENTARMVAIIVSAAVAIIAIIVPLLLGFLDFETNAFLSITLLLVFGVLGFSIPLLVWFTFGNNFPPPRDAAFVLSTLLVLESGQDRTQFEWRNHGYAELFRQVNIESVQGDLELIEDRTTFTEVQTVEPPKELIEKVEEEAKTENLEEETPSS